MGTGSPKKWLFIFEKIDGYCPLRDEFQDFGRQERRAHEHIERRLDFLQRKSLELLKEPEILTYLQDGLWELKLAGGGGNYFFFGSVEYDSGQVRYVALGGYSGKQGESRITQIAIALARLQIHRLKESQRNAFYGLIQ
jgi:hypothetical protein